MVKKIFVSAFILTVIVFSAGIAVGLSFDYFRVSDLSNSFEEERMNIESFVLEQQLLTSLDDQGCDLLNERVCDLITKTYETGAKLEKYETVGYSEEEYRLLKRKNIILKIRLLQSLDYLEENCEMQEDRILYFYERNDEECTKQGYELDKLNRERNYSISVLSFDSNFEEEPLIDYLNKKYEIDTLPTIIINNDVKKEGFVTAEEIEKIFEVF